ncbi:MAG: RNase adapter RapZ, partial [Gallionella sp.]
MQLFLISGLSGSGKSVALKVLEDSGYYCVDNLPADLLAALVEHLQRIGYRNIAVSIDVRSANSVQRLPPLLEQIKQQGVDVHILFLDAQTDTLVKRFSETRRMHPLSDTTLLINDKTARTLPECVSLERELLAEISDIGHHIDTTELNANALRAWIKQFIKLDRARLTLLFQSFGYKHGIPLDADLVFDVRCLPNPHYNPVLQPLTGRDAAVIEFLEKNSGVQDMFNDISNFVERWLPSFVADNRSYLTVAIGCTGGQHRSVYLAEKLARHFEHQ